MNSINDFKFVILERFLSYDNEFTGREGFILTAYFYMLRFARSDSEAYGIDVDRAVFEKVSLVVTPVRNVNLKRTSIKLNKIGRVALVTKIFASFYYVRLFPECFAVDLQYGDIF